jgi:transcriptional regulator with XRE-family HTH domain
MTQQKLAARTGVHQSQISRICRGQFERATAANVARLCKYAKIPIDQDARATRIDSHISKLLGDIIDGSHFRRSLIIRLVKIGAVLAAPPSPTTRSPIPKRP